MRSSFVDKTYNTSIIQYLRVPSKAKRFKRIFSMCIGKDRAYRYVRGRKGYALRRRIVERNKGKRKAVDMLAQRHCYK